MLSLARGLAARQWRVTILAFDSRLPANNEGKFTISYAGVSRALFAPWAVVRAMIEIKPDIVITASPQFSLLAVVVCKAPYFSSRVIVTEHCVPGWDSRRPLTIRVIAAFIGTMVFYRFADAVIAVSPAVARKLVGLVGLPKAAVRIIGNSVLNAELLEKARLSPRHPWLVEKSGPVAIALGHLIEPKGFDILIRAFKQVCDKTAARLIIFGEGGSRSKLEYLIRELGLSERVSLPGIVGNPYAELAVADLLVSASYYEAAPLNIAEALCLGVPIVAAAAKGGVSEMLGNGRFGRLVPVGDADAMAGAIVEAFDAPRAAVPREAVRWLDEKQVLRQWEDSLSEAAGNQAI